MNNLWLGISLLVPVTSIITIMSVYAYAIYIGNDYIRDKNRLAKQGIDWRTRTLNYALKVLKGSKAEVEAQLSVRHKMYTLLYVAFYEDLENKINLSKNALSAYPRTKCLLLSKRTVFNKSFSCDVVTSFNHMLHIVTVELKYNFLSDKSKSPTHDKNAFNTYMTVGKAYYGPLEGVTVDDLKAHNERFIIYSKEYNVS